MSTRIIPAEEIENATIIEVNVREFLSIFKDETPDMILKMDNPRYHGNSKYIYARKNGVFYRTLTEDFKTWEALIKTIKTWAENGFNDKKEYLEAQEYGIENKKDYVEFINSEFHKNLSSRRSYYI